MAQNGALETGGVALPLLLLLTVCVTLNNLLVSVLLQGLTVITLIKTCNGA